MGTRSCSRMALAAAAAASLLAVAPAQAQATLDRSGAHFAVHFHPGALPQALAARLADESLAAAESAWAKTAEWLSLREQKPPAIHVYAEVAAYRAVEKQHGGGAVPIESMARLEAQEAHVLLWPQLSNEALAIVGLPSSTSQAILQRAAQLSVAQFAPTAVKDPWLAEVVGYGVLESIVNPGHKFGLEPAYDTRRSFYFQLLEDRQPPQLKSMVLDFEVPATRRDHDDEEERKCTMAQMMAATGPGWAKKLLAKTKRKVTARVDTRFAAIESVLGTDWVKIESLFSKLGQNVKPVWKENLPMTALRGTRLLMAGNDNHTASFHAVQLPKKGSDYTVRATFELHPCGDDSCRLQLDWDEKSMIGVFFGPGKFQVKRWATGGDWQMLKEGKAPIVAKQPFEAAVEVGKTQLRVLVGGAEVGTWPCGERGMHGRWLMAVNDCVVWIENLRIEYPGAKK
ncbi:MAG TPA: hypothetical protein VFT55_15295 [Planctomycetota bacterium]|nr:hypothetical protein [Planctomycetota bacterium]